MKTLTALFVTAALALGANVALAKDIPMHEVTKLVQDKTILSLDDLNAKALDKHPGATIKESELEDVYGRLVYKIDLRDAKNVEWDVDLDAKTGEILKDVQDK
ncbi:PepSY domain-containing protein [Pseudomonas alkylphenolica]|uniref:Peptidase n=1 Tax=Pseudomonas alkylphenolica TaxID=237609 RepID=A0A077FHK4_9PSED|nr:PepSY domain-containing protein [Pseudomonas alkylphenolica]AIL62666.1 peptidase [Pseudomonas alkylphenolica]